MATPLIPTFPLFATVNQPITGNIFANRLRLNTCKVKLTSTRTETHLFPKVPLRTWLQLPTLGEFSAVRTWIFSPSQFRSVFYLFQEEVRQDRRVSEDAQALSVAEGALPVGKLRETVLKEMFDAMKQVAETLDVESASPCLEVFEDLSRGRGTGTKTSLSDTWNRQRLSDLGDWGMKLLSVALRDPECKVQRLGLYADSLAIADVEDLTLALSTNRSLTEVELDLGWNKLGDSGVKLVSEALRNLECKIDKLCLWCVGLTAAGVVDLASAVSTNRSLTELDLGGNKLGDSGVKLVSEALKNPECKIHKLGLQRAGLTAVGVVDLISALSTNRSVTELDLDDNDLGDSGVKLVSEALRNPECKIHKLGLQCVGLTAAGVVDLASALSTNRPLTDLNLGGNKLGDSGVKLVSEALRNPECKIHKLGLWCVGLTAAGVVDLASTLSTNRSLTELDLGGNKLGDSGVKVVSEALRNPECKIQKLGLRCVGLTAAGVVDLTSALVDLTSALSTNRPLTELNLGGNKLGDLGVKLVSEALRNPECKIHKLDLWCVGLTAAGVVDLASALSTNRSLTELDLGGNKLGDSGVKLVSEALRNPECKIQKLGLGWTGLTDSGTNNLVSVLSTNRSLRELDLRSNSLTDRSVPALRRLTQTLPCLEWLRLDENEFSLNGRDQLKSLAGTRARLRVVL
ncbi:ribonuclease inhibitor-like isoform X3 [Pristis pectinata]|uniref:ribonuclease inhibitor-like isoform X3 n=1 Tax=Pristis pectinata TaxID=685728 RepID=UPI00223E6BF2|nr:ribonuclease inhibitor-like isoform X3 [Pristis pectinata]